MVVNIDNKHSTSNCCYIGPYSPLEQEEVKSCTRVNHLSFVFIGPQDTAALFHCYLACPELPNKRILIGDLPTKHCRPKLAFRHNSHVPIVVH